MPTKLLASQSPASLDALLLYALLGALIGIAAAAFTRGLSSAEDVFDHIRNPYLRNFVSMLIIGVLIYAFLIGAGHYFVEGVGYSTIQAILTGGLDLPALLIILFAAKLAATSISLGAGSFGGIFSPSLFMGAMLGGAFGILVHARPSAGLKCGSMSRHRRPGRKFHTGTGLLDRPTTLMQCSI
jgi:chloride channel protein, CIC family